jgi:hypothetical protein
MNVRARSRFGVAVLGVALLSAGFAHAQSEGRGVLGPSGRSHAREGCHGLPSQGQLKAALQAAVATETSGLNNQMWATIVNRDGVVCAVAFSGTDRAAQWPASRVISAQKAVTANSLSLDHTSFSNGSGQPGGLALSTANLYSAVQPGGSLYGLQHSNPVDPEVAYDGPSQQYGTASDPMVGEKVGGVNVFGGGLALYDVDKKVVGGIGATPPAPTTTSPGACATPSTSTTFPGWGG